jgi:transposase-like protein
MASEVNGVEKHENPTASTGELLHKEDSPMPVSGVLEDDPDKIQRVYELMNRGFKADALARQFGVDPSTIYRWRKRAIEYYRETLESTPVLDIVSDHLLFLDQLERMTLYEMEMLKADGTIVSPDGSVEQVEALKARRLRLEYLKAAREIRKEKINLQTTSGIIPKQPERIYTTIEREKSTVGSNDGAQERTVEEMKAAILELLGKGRQMPVGETNDPRAS